MRATRGETRYIYVVLGRSFWSCFLHLFRTSQACNLYPSQQSDTAKMSVVRISTPIYGHDFVPNEYS